MSPNDKAETDKLIKTDLIAELEKDELPKEQPKKLSKLEESALPQENEKKIKDKYRNMLLEKLLKEELAERKRLQKRKQRI